MKLKTLFVLMVAAAIVICGAPAASAADPAGGNAQGGVIVTTGDITDRPYKVLGDITVRVPRGGIIDPNLDEKVNAALREKAAALHADAVILVHYSQWTGMDIMTMGHVEAGGRAIAFRDGAKGGVQSPSQAQMKATLRAYIDQLNAGNADAVIALYADDATIEDPIGSLVKRGKAEVETFIRSSVAHGVKYELTAPIDGSNIDAAAMAVKVRAGPAQLNVIEIYSFDDDGRIASMKAYWGSEDRKAE